MKKYWPIIVTILIIPLFIISGLICCCFSSDAAAEEISSSCHSEIHEGQNNDTSQADENCACASIELVTPKNISNITAVRSSDVDQFAKSTPVPRYYSLVSAETPAYQGPPSLASRITPIYLQNSNLQL